MLVEWPQRGEGVLPTADLTVTLTSAAETGRELAIEGGSERGNAVLDALATAPAHDP
jgi:tRNA threonylcarbamoyladenosine biosynthesis protein TsaE